jgi:hypothetical protein
MRPKKVLHDAFIGTRSGTICLFIRRPGKNPGQEQKRERALPMLAKRFIVAAFAALAIAMTPLAFPGDRDLFVDVAPMPAVMAAN